MKLSIITINYNNSHGLQKTIESVISQTSTNYEFIIIDGGSNDGSLEVIEKYSNHISYWVSELDKGIYNAMNKGIRNARGEYCLFLNSGDWLYSSDVIEKVFPQDHEVASIITGDLLKVQQDNSTELDKGQAFTRQEQNERLTLYDMIMGTINHPSSFIKRKLFNDYGLYDESYKLVSDWIFFLKTIGIYGVDVKYIDVAVSCFDMTGISNSNKELLNAEREKALQSFVPMQILNDYRYFSKIDYEYTALKTRHKYLFRFSFTYFVARATNKFIRTITIIKA